MRAISVEVNEFSGVAGLITPGCRVDLIATINEGSDSMQVARTIVQNVKVTAVGRSTSGSGASEGAADELSRSVTVLVSPTEAEAIDLACSTGRPRLVLRGGRDQQIEETPGISLSDLRGGAGRIELVAPPEAVVVAPPALPLPPVVAPEPAVVAERPARRVIKMIKGGVESTVVLSLPNAASAEAYGTTDSTDPFGEE
jgi:Flp pilus assembly protein CpaB